MSGKTAAAAGVATVALLLAEARAAAVDGLDAQLLLARALERPRSWLLAHAEAPLTALQAAEVRGRIARRAAGEPLAYLLGDKEFHGLLLRVDPGVLVPRPDTELLVDWALELLDGELARVERPRVADLGTGSGAVALAVGHRWPAALVLATDISAAALDTARANARRLGLAVSFLQSAWWQGLGERRFDLVLSNPPYIAEDDIHLDALWHEPRIALTPGGDGLGALRQIIAGAPSHLEPGGWLLLEHGFDQADAVHDLLHRHGFSGVQSRRDLAGHWRCSAGRSDVTQPAPDVS